MTDAKAELQQLAREENANGNAGNNRDREETNRLVDDLLSHIRELEDQRARVGPIISLVDNMVKLGSLYRGPGEAPLSHRIRNLPAAPVGEVIPPPAAAEKGRKKRHSSGNRKNPFPEDDSKERKEEIQVRLKIVSLSLFENSE